MEKGHRFNFRKTVLKALHQGTIDKVEAKECLKRGFDNQELPLFDDFDSGDPFRVYINGLKKMELMHFW